MLFERGLLFLGRGSFLGDVFKLRVWGGVALRTPPAREFSFSDISVSLVPMSSDSCSNCLVAIPIFSLSSRMSSSTSSSISPGIRG